MNMTLKLTNNLANGAPKMTNKEYYLAVLRRLREAIRRKRQDL